MRSMVRNRRRAIDQEDQRDLTSRGGELPGHLESHDAPHRPPAQEVGALAHLLLSPSPFSSPSFLPSPVFPSSLSFPPRPSPAHAPSFLASSAHRRSYWRPRPDRLFHTQHRLPVHASRHCPVRRTAVPVSLRVPCVSPVDHHDRSLLRVSSAPLPGSEHRKLSGSRTASKMRQAVAGTAATPRTSACPPRAGSGTAHRQCSRRWTTPARTLAHPSHTPVPHVGSVDSRRG